MTHPSPEEALHIAREAACAAGQHALREIHRRGEVAERTRYDVKLVLDRECQSIAEETIRAACPTHPILGEEGSTEGDEPDFMWVIDPIDGTVNFSHTMPLWCSSVALLHKGESIAGAVYVPPLDELYTATLDGPALCNGTPIAPSGVQRLEEALICSGLTKDMHSEPAAMRSFQNLARRAQKVRIMGAAAIDICHVACGRADGYFELGIYLWDVAAAGLIARRAGAQTRILEELGPHHMRYLCATPGITEELLACFPPPSAETAPAS